MLLKPAPSLQLYHFVLTGQEDRQRDDSNPANGMNGDTKTVDPKVDFSDTKNLVSKKSSRKTKIAVVGALAVALLLGAVVSLSLFLSLKKTSSTPVRLTEVNLEEGETLTYRVDQKLEVSEGKVLTGMFNSLFNFSKSYDCFK